MLIKSDLVKKGIIAEHKIIIELLNKGWNIYQNLCDDNGIDFIIEKKNIFYTIQIKSAYSKHKEKKTQLERYFFRYGNAKIKPDFTICCIPEGVIIIHKTRFKSNQGFNYYPTSIKHKHLLNNWQILNQGELKQ